MILGRALWNNFGHNKQQPKKGCWQVRNLDIWKLPLFGCFFVILHLYLPIYPSVWGVVSNPDDRFTNNLGHFTDKTSMSRNSPFGGLGPMGSEDDGFWIWNLNGMFGIANSDLVLWAQVPCRADQGAERLTLVAHAARIQWQSTICQLKI